MILIASMSGIITLKVRNGRIRRFPHDVDGVCLADADNLGPRRGVI